MPRLTDSDIEALFDDLWDDEGEPVTLPVAAEAITERYEIEELRLEWRAKETR